MINNFKYNFLELRPWSKFQLNLVKFFNRILQEDYDVRREWPRGWTEHTRIVFFASISQRSYFFLDILLHSCIQHLIKFGYFSCICLEHLSLGFAIIDQKTIVRHLKWLNLLILTILLGVSHSRIRHGFILSRGLWLVWVFPAHFGLDFVKLLHARCKILPHRISIHTKFLLSSISFGRAGILLNLVLLIFIILLLFSLFLLDVGVHKRFIGLTIYLLSRIWHHLAHSFVHFLEDFFTGFQLLLVELFNRLVELLFVVLALGRRLIRVRKVGK